MSTDLLLVVRREEGVLVRLLGLIVRRGFEPTRLEGYRSVDGRRFRLDITVQSDRSIDTLIRQLKKLYEVEEVRLKFERSPPEQSPAAAAE